MTNNATLSSLSHSFADAVQVASEGVLRIRTGRRVGSGIAFSTDGLIVTVASAIGRQASATVTLPDGTDVEAKVLGVEPALDLALLQVDVELTPLERVDGSELRVGSLAVVLGRPGRGVRATLGMVSARSKDPWTTPLGASVSRFIEVDASLPPGFGGGALIDSDGFLVGMNSRNLVRGGTTIPSDSLESTVEQLAKHGTRIRGWIGVRFEAVTLDGAPEKAGTPRTGLLVRKAAKESPAILAGVRIGDVLVALDDEPLGSWRQLAKALTGAVGRAQPLKVLRDGKIVELTVTPMEKPSRHRC